jgi:hypothetical protein
MICVSKKSLYICAQFWGFYFQDYKTDYNLDFKDIL